MICTGTVRSNNRLVGLAGTQDASDKLFAEGKILDLFQEVRGEN